MATRVDSVGKAYREHLNRLGWIDVLGSRDKGDALEDIDPTAFLRGYDKFVEEELIVCTVCDAHFMSDTDEENELCDTGEYVCDECKTI